MKLTIKTFCSAAKHKHEIKRHEKSHDEPTHQCNICEKQFFSPGALNNHNNWSHLELIVANCHVCGSGFKSLQGLKKHLQYIHAYNEIERRQFLDRFEEPDSVVLKTAVVKLVDISYLLKKGK